MRPGIDTSEVAVLLPWLVPAGALGVGLPLVGGALLGIRRAVTVDPNAGLISERARGPFRLTWTRSQALAREAVSGSSPRLGATVR